MTQPISALAMDTVRAAVDAQFDGNVAEAAKAWGVKNDNLHKWLRGDRSPKLELIGPVLDKLGFSLAKQGCDHDGFDLVPKVAAVAGCGESLETDDSTLGWYAFRKEFFLRLGIRAKSCVLMTARGDSMEPLIKEGDTLLVDESQNEPRDGAIYAVGLAEALMVKRLQKIPAGWNLCSENPTSPPVPVTHENLDQFRVYGRVRWFGRVL